LGEYFLKYYFKKYRILFYIRDSKLFSNYSNNFYSFFLSYIFAFRTLCYSLFFHMSFHPKLAYQYGERLVPADACTAPCPTPLRVPRPAWFPMFAVHTHSTPTRMQAGPIAAADRVHCNMCNTRSIFVTSRGHICNIRPKQLKHLQHTSETLGKHVCSHGKIYATFRWNTCNICVKTYATSG
jgi:hypothetical protein